MTSARLARRSGPLRRRSCALDTPQLFLQGCDQRQSVGSGFDSGVAGCGQRSRAENRICLVALHTRGRYECNSAARSPYGQSSRLGYRQRHRADPAAWATRHPGAAVLSCDARHAASDRLWRGSRRLSTLIAGPGPREGFPVTAMGFSGGSPGTSWPRWPPYAGEAQFVRFTTRTCRCAIGLFPDRFGMPPGNSDKDSRKSDS